MALAVTIQHTLHNSGPIPFKLDISTEFKNNQINALFGPSGAGKTSLLRVVAGLEKKANAEIIHGQTIWQNRNCFLPPHKRDATIVFQNSLLFPHLNVNDNLNYAIRRATINSRAALIDKNKTCKWFQLKPLLDKFPNQLSAGEKQRVALARALLSQPNWLLLDEPIANLDDQNKGLILEQLKFFNENLGLSIIFVSHDLEDICQIANQLHLFQQGKITVSGSLAEVLNEPSSHFSADEAGAIIEGHVKQHDDENHLTSIIFPGGELFLQKFNAPIDSKVNVRIPAKDVSINLDYAENSSVLNIISAKVISIKSQKSGRALVKLQVGDQSIISYITQKSLKRLELSPEKKVFAQIKTTSFSPHPFIEQKH